MDRSVSHDPPQGDGTLLTLRRSIDELDHRLASLIAERQEIVRQIAGIKESAGAPIRDPQREAEILSQRRDVAQSLGLPVHTVESIFRLLLMASREKQASLRLGDIEASERKRIVVVGGEGAMGKSVSRMFSRLGHELVSCDLGTPSTAVEEAPHADVVVVSVPILDTVPVIREVGPRMREDALLMDVTSLKAPVLEAMLAHSASNVLGTHPMYGPGVHSLEGQRIAVCAGRGALWHRWALDAFRRLGLVVVETEPAPHDRAMAVVQVLNHMQTQTLGLALARLGWPLSLGLEFASPAYLLEAYVTARHFGQSPALYGAIEMRNPHTREVSQAFLAAARDITDVLARGDQDAFVAIFDEVRAFFGSFVAEAEVQSGLIIDRLVELGTGNVLSSRDDQPSVNPRE